MSRYQYGESSLTEIDGFDDDPLYVEQGYTLSAGEGLKTIKVNFKESYGSYCSNISRQIIYDITPPGAVTNPGPAHNTFTNDNTPTLTWNASTDTLSGLHPYPYRVVIDGGAPSAWLNTTSFTTGALSDGPHTWKVEVCDKAGNIKTNGTVWTVNIDTIKPADPTAAQLNKLGFDNASGKVTASGDFTGGDAYPEPCQLEVYIGAIASPPTRLTAATGSETAFSSTHVSGDAIITGIAAMTAGHGVWYRFKDRAGNISAWVQDGKVPAAPVISASAITADLGSCDNTVDHINNALKNAFNNFKVNVANTATGNEAGTIYMKLSDSAGTPNTYTTAGNAIAAAAAAANRGTFVAGAIDSFMNGNILIESWIKNAAGNSSTWASVNKAGCLDTVLMDTLDLAAL
ncbi:MAG TPA: Ig-like domain-containing protein, partial [Candidatus Wallbacteria bacterium]|nr:Ig-like domain-containing protein [Candidatus Wallbacteria bacterium]